jgi:polar amino acid transport system substrate-binding protein
LIGHACGIGFSFFSEAPFFFTEALGLPQKYFFLCFIIVGWAWYLGGNISQRLMKQYAIQVVMLKGIYLSACASILFCIAVCLFPASLFLVVVSLILIFLIMVGLGLVIGNAITLALEPFSQFSGVAASTLGFLYYSIIALVAFGMAELHNGTVFSMPFYWLHVIIICSLIVYYIQPEVDPIIKPIV